MENLKSSYYNVITKMEESGEYLLYNLVNGGLEVLSTSQGKWLETLQKEEDLNMIAIESEQKEFAKYLFSKGFLVNVSKDEKKEYHNRYLKKQSYLYNREEASINLTIGTTIVCNMGCSYCFEFIKPNKSLKSKENLTAIIFYLNDMIKKAPVKKWKGMNVTWYGGEPLVYKTAISDLTPMLKELCEKHQMSYYANIITNGILLTEENWNLLEKADIKDVQITIDGPQRIHDVSRPLKGKKGQPNYRKILQNLTNIPKRVNATIRINTDKQVANGIDELLEDFKEYQLWPNKSRQISFKPAWLRTYEEANEEDTSMRFNADDFFEFKQSFRLKLLKEYNSWALEMGYKPGKLKWELPEIQDECATWVSPYSLVVDPDGNIHKCWETIHDDVESIGHVSNGFNLKIHEDYMNYDRVELNDICSSCKFLPVCEKLSCSHDALKKGKPDCTWWKTKTEDVLKLQYGMMKEFPDLIKLPGHEILENTGHTNK